MQANLPVRCGGLGIPSVLLLAPSAFLASAAATLSTQTALLPVNFQPRDGFAEGVAGIWSTKYSCPTSDAGRAVKQRSWDEAPIQHALQCLLESCSTQRFLDILYLGSCHCPPHNVVQNYFKHFLWQVLEIIKINVRCPHWRSEAKCCLGLK